MKVNDEHAANRRDGGFLTALGANIVAAQDTFHEDTGSLTPLPDRRTQAKVSLRGERVG